MTGPISPKDVSVAKQKYLPEEVFEVFNTLIAKYYNGHSASFKMKEAASMLAEKMNITTDEIYSNKYLDVETVYRQAGWTVRFDSPAYNESFDANYQFSK